MHKKNRLWYKINFFFQLCFRFIGLTALLKQRLFVLTCHESPIIFWFSHWGKCIWKWFKVHPPVWMGSHLIISSGRVASPIQEMHSPHETNSDPYNSSSALFSFGLSSSPSNFFSCLVILNQSWGTSIYSLRSLLLPSFLFCGCWPQSSNNCYSLYLADPFQQFY